MGLRKIIICLLAGCLITLSGCVSTHLDNDDISLQKDNKAEEVKVDPIEEKIKNRESNYDSRFF